MFPLCCSLSELGALVQSYEFPCNPTDCSAITCNWVEFGWLLKGLTQWAHLCDFLYISHQFSIPLRGMAWHGLVSLCRNQSDLGELMQSWAFPCNPTDCLRIAKNAASSRNHLDCKYRGLDCGRIATNRKSSFRGLRGTERIAEDPRATAWACPPVWAQTWRTAVRLGLISDCTKIAQFSLDCMWIGPIEPGLHRSHWIAFLLQLVRLRGDCPVFGNPTAIGIGRLRIDWVVY